MPTTPLPLLNQREIEARIVGPLIRAFASELGEVPWYRLTAPLFREVDATGTHSPA